MPFVCGELALIFLAFLCVLCGSPLLFFPSRSFASFAVQSILSARPAARGSESRSNSHASGPIFPGSAV